MKAQENLFLIACSIDFMTKILAASSLAIFFELQNCRHERDLKTKTDFCHDSLGLRTLFSLIGHQPLY